MFFVAGRRSAELISNGDSALKKDCRESRRREDYSMAVENPSAGVVFFDDWNHVARPNIWSDVHGEKYPSYVVQTAVVPIQRCILMTTDPGDLVLDPTCGSGTTATVAEQWGRRWITTDTSRVALALARARLMGARYPFYLLSDSPEGLRKEGEITGRPPADRPTHGDIRQGFVYERVPHITLKSIANNAEIDVIWDKWQETLEPLRASLGAALGKSWEDWEIPREADAGWPAAATEAQCGVVGGPASPGRRRSTRPSRGAADTEFLYDKPCEDRKTVRVAGPFTVESLSPHRVMPADIDDGLWDDLVAAEAIEAGAPGADTHAQAAAVGGCHRLRRDGARPPGARRGCSRRGRRTASFSPACRRGRAFTWPPRAGSWRARPERKAAIFIGPEFGTVSRPDMTAAAREAAEAGFDLLIACALQLRRPCVRIPPARRAQRDPVAHESRTCTWPPN